MPTLTALVPLDTTENSETAFLVLPMLKGLGFGRLRLICVWDKDQRQPLRRDGRTFGATWGPEYMQTYLDEQAVRVAGYGYEVDTQVRSGAAADVCVRAASEPDVDLVLLATHGRTGLARMRLGSVADNIIKDSVCPTLVLGPNLDIELASYSLKRILVPLDGSELAEMSLPIAKYVAKLSGAQIVLLRTASYVVADSEAMIANANLMDGIIAAAGDYVDGIAAKLEGFDVDKAVLTGSAAAVIRQYQAENDMDLVIMASHGRTGVGRFARGSITEMVLHGPDPVLVFEQGEDKGGLFAAARGAQ